MPRDPKFVPDPPDRQRNPNSLRLLFQKIRTQYAGPKVKRTDFAKILNTVGRNFLRKRFTRTVLHKIEAGHEYISYVHIEKYAKYVGIPSGWLLLFSRMLANQRDGFKDESNADLARRTIAIMSRINDQTLMDIDELKAWRRIFEEAVPAASEAPAGDQTS